VFSCGDPVTQKKTEPKAILVVAGKDAALVKRRVGECVDALLSPDERAMALLSLTGKEAQIAQVLDELRTLPFLAERRVVVIQDADPFVTAQRSALETYFEQPSPSGILILAVGSWPGNTRLAKKLKSAGELISVDPPKPWHMARELVALTSQRYQKRLALPAAELLVQLTGDNWSGLQGELDKLVLFVGQARDITVAQVEALVGHNRVFGAFEVIDAMSSGNAGEALKRLRNLFAEDKAAQYTVVGAFAYHFRRLFSGKALLTQGRSPADVAKALRLWAKKDLFFAQLRRLSLEQIGTYLQSLAEIDYQIKTGRMRPAVAMEQLVLRVSVSRG